MKIYSIKEHFELRNTRSLSIRPGYGRYFEHQGKPGFSDASGCVWPVLIEPTLDVKQLQDGCVYSFRVCGQPSQQIPASKYRDKETFLFFTGIERESGNENSQWDLNGIVDPRSCQNLPELNESVHGTFFFLSPTSRRIEKIAERALGIQRVRQYFLKRGYVELDPPTLVLSGGLERYLNMFKTVYHDHKGQTWGMDLPTSPELSLKKIVAEGVSRIFAISHSFRNQGELSRHHDPEFMMLEWYRQGSSLKELLTETQFVISEVAASLPGANSLPKHEWPAFEVPELFATLLKIDLRKYSDVAIFRKKASVFCASVRETDTWDDVFCKLFMEFIEPFLKGQKACFVTHYPEQMGALAARSKSLPGCVERFEAYIDGIEICNGYVELIDSLEYQNRVGQLLIERTDISIDPLFASVMNVGLYPCAGNALGLDRLIAVLRGEKDLQSMLPWPFSSRFPKSSIALE